MKNVKFVVLPFHVLAMVGAVWAWQGGRFGAFLLAALLSWIVLGAALEVGTHRLFSHAAFKASRSVTNMLALLATLVGQGTIIFWVAVHRGYHHPYADTDRDPHSPVAHGLWHAYVGWLTDAGNEKLTLRGSVNLLRDPVQVWLHEHYFRLIWSFLLLFALTSPIAAAGYVTASVICFHQTMLVNMICHTSLGARLHETKDSSRNVWWLAPFTWGLSLHNTHHAKPGEPNFGSNWYEIDPSWWVIRLLQAR